MQNENCKLKNANWKVRIRESDLCVEIDNMSGYLIVNIAYFTFHFSMSA